MTSGCQRRWIPAFAGMTSLSKCHSCQGQILIGYQVAQIFPGTFRGRTGVRVRVHGEEGFRPQDKTVAWYCGRRIDGARVQAHRYDEVGSLVERPIQGDSRGRG